MSITYDGSGSTSGFRIYEDGVQVDNESWASGPYTAMENTMSLVRLGFLQGESGPSGFYAGKLAGGPAGPFFTAILLTPTDVSDLYTMGLSALGLP